LAAAYYNLGRFNDSLAAYKQILKEKPDYAVGYSNLGLVYEQLKDTVAAADAYQNAIRLNPMLIEPLNNLAGIYLGAGDAKKAASLYEAALKIDPNNPQILRNYGLATRK
jgi:tetratricopeptide (TPR) repeat protein